MKIEEFDEFQGLTSEALAAWLARAGWKQETMKAYQFASPPAVIGHRFLKNGHAVCTGCPLDEAVALIVAAEQRPVQALLREINPRLRPWPSDAARFAHRGYWLAVCTQDGTACMGRFRADMPWFKHSGDHILTEEDSFAGYWPCDASGNKVRWPEKDGVML